MTEMDELKTLQRERDFNWKAQDPDSTDDRWVADVFVSFYHIHSKWLGPPTRGSTYTVWVTPWPVHDLHRWETVGHVTLGEFDTFAKAAAAAQADYEQRILSALNIGVTND